MKALLYPLVLAAFVFTGCFETTEELTVNDKGSGMYQTKIDLSGIFDFMDMMKSMDTSGTASKNQFPQNKDTLIHMRSFTDTASNLTPEEKALMREATMHVAMSDKERTFKIDMNFPYSRLSDVQKIIAINQTKSNLLGKALSDKANMPVQNEGISSTMPDFGSLYDYTYQSGKLERKLNKTKLQQFEASESYATMKQMKEMFSSSAMNTVIHLPKPAKKAEGSKVKLSGDKKTITINATFEDVVDHPDLLSYHIEY